jgi:hypothetical protein
MEDRLIGYAVETPTWKVYITYRDIAIMCYKQWRVTVRAEFNSTYLNANIVGSCTGLHNCILCGKTASDVK